MCCKRGSWMKTNIAPSLSLTGVENYEIVLGLYGRENKRWSNSHLKENGERGGGEEREKHNYYAMTKQLCFEFENFVGNSLIFHIYFTIRSGKIIVSAKS